jgi:hypothetical protein
MDTAVALPLISFRQAKASLQKRRMTTFYEAYTRLHSISFQARSASILAELNPARYLGLREKVHFLTDYDEELVSAALEEICTIAPLDTEFIETGLLGAGEDFQYLYPAPMGFPMGWDEWEEIATDPAGCNESMELFIFVSSLRLHYDSTLEQASEHFDWDLPKVDLERYSDLDWERMYKLLDQAGLSCFKRAIDVCLYSTDNPYFDFNPYDEDANAFPDLPPYSLDGVHQLEAFYQAAKPIQADFEEAENLFENCYGLPWKLLKIWLSCCKKVKPERRRVRVGGPERTLAEIWGEVQTINTDIQNLEGELQRIIDPFYGPLDGMGDPDEEEGEE